MTTIKVLTDSQLEQMKNAVETILSDVGVRVEDDGLRRLYRSRGAGVDDVSGGVKLPPKLIWELLSTVPASFVLRDMLGEETLVGGGEAAAVGLVLAPIVADSETGEARPPRLSDVTAHTKINLRLPRITATQLPEQEVSDVSGPRSAYRAMEEYLSLNHRPMVLDCSSDECFSMWKELAPIVAPGGRVRDSGLFMARTVLSSPLVFTRQNAEISRWAAEHRLPLSVASCPASVAAPCGFAATLARSCAESLFSVCTSQLLSSGTPVLMDAGMPAGKSGPLYDSWDRLKWVTAAAALGRLFGLPVQSHCGGSPVLCHDIQQGGQSLLSVLFSVLSGASCLSGIGSVLRGTGMSPVSLVYQHEWLRYSGHVRRGIGVEALGRSVLSIAENSPSDNFLCDELTLENLRSDVFFQEGLFDYSGNITECRPMLEKVREEAAALTDGYESQVPGKVREELERYFSGLYGGLGQ